MKIKDGFILRPFEDQYLAMPVGSAAARSPFMLSLNSTCAYVWELLGEDRSYEQLLEALLQRFDADEDIVKKDLDGFLKVLKEADVLQ